MPHQQQHQRDQDELRQVKKTASDYDMGEVAEIMDASTWDDIAFSGKAETSDQVFKQSCIHFFIVHKTNRLAFTAILDAFFYFLYESRAHIIVDIQLCILGYFEYMGIKMIVTKIREDIGQVEANNIF